MRVPIAVVGAGITGLSLAYFLERRGVDHVVLEASARAGGVIRTTRPGGRVLEHGPQRMRLSGPLHDLVRSLGLDAEMIAVPPGHPLYVVRGGRLRRVPFGPGQLLKSDLLSIRGKLRLLSEPFTAPAREGETVGGYLSRKLGREAYEAAAGPLFGGLYGSDPDDMFVRHALAATLGSGGGSSSLVRRFLRRRAGRGAAPPAVSFEEGMERLPAALLRSLGDRVRLEAPAVGLRRSGANGSGWIVEVGGEHPGEVRADELALTVPAPDAARLLREAAPDAAERLASLRYNPLALVHLEGRCDLHGLGYQVAFGEPLRTRGVSWNASALRRDGVYTAFLGGARDPALVELDDAAMGDIAREEMRAVTGCTTRVLGVSRTRMPAWDRSWSALDDLALPPHLHLCANYESRAGLPGRVARTLELAERLV